MKLRHYVTACRKQQLPVLLQSMDAYCQPYRLHVLAWDWDSWSEVNFDRVQITRRGSFLERHPGLAPEFLPGPTRSRIEQVCTARWTFVVDVMEDFGAPVTMIDGDIWFWGRPDDVFEEIGGARCAVTQHGFPHAEAGLPGASLESHRQYGAFNGGWVYFGHRDPAIFMAISTKGWMYSDFLELPRGRRLYGDQGFLELMQEGHRGHIIQHEGVNVGPWNVHARPLSVTPSGRLRAGAAPLVSYHYSSFLPGVQDADAAYQLTDHQRKLLYEPYAAAVKIWWAP